MASVYNFRDGCVRVVPPSRVSAATAQRCLTDDHGKTHHAEEAVCRSGRRRYQVPHVMYFHMGILRTELPPTPAGITTSKRKTHYPSPVAGSDNSSIIPSLLPSSLVLRKYWTHKPKTTTHFHHYCAYRDFALQRSVTEKCIQSIATKYQPRLFFRGFSFVL